VSKYAHCLLDLLARTVTGEWPVEIPLIISNHNDLEPIALNGREGAAPARRLRTI